MYSMQSYTFLHTVLYVRWYMYCVDRKTELAIQADTNFFIYGDIWKESVNKKNIMYQDKDVEKDFLISVLIELVGKI